LCNSESGDIALCNKNNSEWGFCAFLKKEQKLVCFEKNKKMGFKKTSGLFFLKKRFFLNPDCLPTLL